MEIPRDKKVVNSTSELKWISVCNNDTSDLLASLNLKKEASGTIMWPVLIASTASFLILILMIILIFVMMRRREVGTKENDTEKRINENKLNEKNELNPGEYDTYTYDSYYTAEEMKPVEDYDCYYK